MTETHSQSIFNPHFLELIRESLAEGLEERLSTLESELSSHNLDANQRLETRIRQYSVALTMTECYMINSEKLVVALKNLSEEYWKQGYLAQSYIHSVDALNKYKVYQQEINNDRLQDQLYVNLCENCYASKSYREALYYVQEYYKKTGSVADSKVTEEGISLQVRVLFVQAKTLYKIGDLKESEKTLQKCLESLEQNRIETQLQVARSPNEQEIREQFFRYQTDALNHLQKIAKKETNYNQMAEFIRQILRCCSSNEKTLIDKTRTFEVRVKFSLTQLDYFDVSNPVFYPVSKALNKVIKATPEFVEAMNVFVEYLRVSLESDLSLLDSLKGKSTLDRLLKMLVTQIGYFYAQKELNQMLNLSRVLNTILKYFEEQPTFKSCAYYLLYELLKMRVEKDLSQEGLERVQSELRTIQKMARLIKNSFLKETTKALSAAVESAAQNNSSEKLNDVCMLRLGPLMDKIKSKAEGIGTLDSR